MSPYLLCNGNKSIQFSSGSRSQTNELIGDSLRGPISSGDKDLGGVRVSHHPLVVLPVDGDRLLLDDGVGDLMEVAEHVPALVLLLLLGALLLPVHLVLLRLAFFFGDHARLSGGGTRGKELARDGRAFAPETVKKNK